MWASVVSPCRLCSYGAWAQSVACGMLLDQELNSCSPNWQADSHLLYLQGSPVLTCFLKISVVVVYSFSRVQLFVIPWTVACQASLSFSISPSLLKFMFTESMILANHLILSYPFLLLHSTFPSIKVFSMSQLFASGAQSMGASASVLLRNTQGWFPLGLTCVVSLQSEGLSRVFSSTIWKHQFSSTQPSLWYSSHICTRLLEKPWLWLFESLSAKRCLCFLICCLGLS